MQPAPRKPPVGHGSKSNGNRRAAKYRRCLKSPQHQVYPLRTSAGRRAARRSPCLIIPARGDDQQAGDLTVLPAGLRRPVRPQSLRIYPLLTKPTPPMSGLIPYDAHPIASSTSKPSLTIPGLISTPIPHATATPPLDPTSSCTYTTSSKSVKHSALAEIP